MSDTREAWIYAYTSLGAPREVAECMVAAEISAYERSAAPTEHAAVEERPGPHTDDCMLPSKGDKYYACYCKPATLSAPSDYLEWVEPMDDGGTPMICRALKSDIAKVQRKREPRYENDEQAIEDFRVVHWASEPSDKPAHTDHPLRHWDRTCPACQAEDTVPLDDFSDLPSETPSGLVEFLESREFYELCQQYRHTPGHMQEHVVEAFEHIKDALRRAAAALLERA